MQRYSGPVWRIIGKTLSATPAIAAAAPEGRFHHSGQVAVYASLSAEGAAVAIRRYLGDGVPRVLVPMWLDASAVVDIRDAPGASIIWQDLRAAGAWSPTWQFSDDARRAGAQAMLYASRSRPDLSHVVIFEPACLRVAGPIADFTG